MRGVNDDVVDQLTRLLTEGDIDTFQNADATALEKETAAQIFKRMIVFMLQDAGVVKSDSATALDLPMYRLAALAAVWQIVSKWERSRDRERTLGQLLMILPTEDVTAVEAALVWGGMARVVSDDSDGDRAP